MINRNLLPLFVALACAASPSNAAPQAAKKTVASGQTQVVANVGGREVTLSELRMEMGRIGLSASDPNAERLALESLTNRILLSKAARTADLHRKPDVMARMYAAQDQALADYYLALATRPAEPTREEIDDFIKENPSLFADRKLYDFLVFTLETKNFNESALTPLFDREADFSRLAAVMTKAGARYSIAPAMQSGAAFPAPMRTQLGKYSARDNIVIKGDTETQIMKIVAVKNDVADQAGWPELARRSLIEMDAAKRAEALIARLRKETDVAYFRATSAPASPVKAE
jgi:EpsD family peptidyl-prolyl cis-trans isomerase